MANLVVDVRHVFHSVRDFIAQEPPVTLPQIVELLFYHCLCDSQSSREIGIRYLPTSRGKMSAQRFEQPEPAFAFAFLAKTLKGVFYNCYRPTEIKKLLRQNILEGFSRDGGQFQGRQVLPVRARKEPTLEAGAGAKYVSTARRGRFRAMKR